MIKKLIIPFTLLTLAVIAHKPLRGQDSPQFTETNSPLEVRGSYAYAGLTNEFTVIDVSDPNDPISVGVLSLPNQIVDIELDNNLAYISYGPGLWVIDIAVPTQPIKISEYTAHPIWYMILDGDYLYATSEHFMRILDITSWQNINQIGYYESNPHTLSGLIDISKQDNMVYVMGDNPGITWILDVSNPSNPTYLARVNHGGWEMEIQDNILFLVTTGCNSSQCYMFFTSYDITNPADPNLLGCFCGIPWIIYVDDLIIESGWAYIANNQDLRIIGVADPSNFAPLPPLPVAGARAIAVSGNYIYLITDNNTLQILESPLTRIYLPTIYR